jgi:glycerol-3-phosphate cytidylyltransferase
MIIDLQDFDSVLVLNDFLSSTNPRLVTGLVSGAFDLFHYNHLRFIKECAFLCDFLIVGIGTDRLVRQNKGPERPIIHQLERLQIINSLRAVDAAFLMDSEADYGTIAYHLIAPFGGVHFKTYEWANKYEKIPGYDGEYIYDPGPNKQVTHCKGNVILLGHGQPGTVSTSGIIKRIRGEKNE